MQYWSHLKKLTEEELSLDLDGIGGTISSVAIEITDCIGAAEISNGEEAGTVEVGTAQDDDDAVIVVTTIASYPCLIQDVIRRVSKSHTNIFPFMSLCYKVALQWDKTTQSE